jgi:hypothetical protein
VISSYLLSFLGKVVNSGTTALAAQEHDSKSDASESL